MIIVGDKMQTSPGGVQGVDRLESIAREHIFGHRLENRIGADLSLYDVAEVMTGPDMLIDHFRCVPDIIDISNRLSYQPMGRALRPSRVREPGALEPVVHVRVEGRRQQSSWANTQEVEAIVEQVVDCHADPAYTGMDFGVVVVGPQPTAHVRHLRNQLLDKLGATAMRERNLEIGTATEFQGAERNVMFLSLIVAAGHDEVITNWPHEHSGRNRKRVQELNVAVSRARDQLWIFHSFDSSQLRPNDARAVVLETPRREQRDLWEQLDKCESQFERDVVVALAEADPGLILRTQVEAIGYSIDIVVEDHDGHRLAVECDGDRWHSSDSQIRRDLYRQRTLETIGWRFNRFLASEWYADPGTYVRRILEDLVRSDIPVVTRATPPTADGENDDAGEDDGEFEPRADGTDEDEPSAARSHLDAPESTSTHPAPAATITGPDDQKAEPGGSTQPGRSGNGREETLICTRCGRSWTRERKRGRKPAVCPTCLAAGNNGPAGQGETETLTCLSCARQWQRPIKRGIKPSKCPECQKTSKRTSSPKPDVVIRETNRILAQALRAQGKVPSGETWQRAKSFLIDGTSIQEAADRAWVDRSADPVQCRRTAPGFVDALVCPGQSNWPIRSRARRVRPWGREPP